MIRKQSYKMNYSRSLMKKMGSPPCSQIAMLRWPNVGPTYAVYIGPTLYVQRLANVILAGGPTLAQRYR